MAAELIPVGTTAANSADIVVAAGTPIALALKGAVTGARCVIELKDDAAVYHYVADLLDFQPPAALFVPGTYRVRRIAGAACGVYSG